MQFQDSGVSALHAKIANEGERWKVIDQMSANGTFVNGKRANVSYLVVGRSSAVWAGRVCVSHRWQQRASRSRRRSGSLMLDAGEETKGKSLVDRGGGVPGDDCGLFAVYKFLL